MYPDTAYPLRKEIVPIWLAAFLGSVVPVVVILLMQIRVRSFWDVNNGVLGLLYSLITAAVFQVFLKCLVGGLRPHFLAVCKPDVNLAAGSGSPYNAAGFRQLYYTSAICTGDQAEINDSLESFPSGHSTAAFAGFVFLSLYLNAKLKVFADYHPALWKLAAVWAPVLAATLIAGALTVDEFHHWYDAFAGAAIGTAMAFSAYRMVYAAVWDWRFNHVPLNRTRPTGYGGGGGPGAMELADVAVATRKVGWGSRAAGDGDGDGYGYGYGYGQGHGHGHGNHGHHGQHGAEAMMPQQPQQQHTRKPVGGVGAGGVPGRGDEMV